MLIMFLKGCFCWLTYNEDFDCQNYSSYFVLILIRSYSKVGLIIFNTISRFGPFWSSEVCHSVLTRFVKGQFVGLTYTKDPNLQNSSSYFVLSPINPYSTIWLIILDIVSQLGHWRNVIPCWLGFWSGSLPNRFILKIPIVEIKVSISFLVQLSHIQRFGWLFLILLISWISSIKIFRICQIDKLSHKKNCQHKKSFLCSLNFLFFF